MSNKQYKHLDKHGKLIWIYMGISSKDFMSVNHENFKFDFTYNESIYFKEGFFQCSEQTTCYLEDESKFYIIL